MKLVKKFLMSTSLYVAGRARRNKTIINRVTLRQYQVNSDFRSLFVAITVIRLTGILYLL